MYRNRMKDLAFIYNAIQANPADASSDADEEKSCEWHSEACEGKWRGKLTKNTSAIRDIR